MQAFSKNRPGRADARRFFATEAAGLAWLRVPGGPPLPSVLELNATGIVLERIHEGRPTPEAAEELGRRLAALHSAGAPAFGAPPPGAPGPDGWIGDLPMPYAHRSTFAQFWAVDRLAPTVRMASDRGGLDRQQAATLDRAVGAILDGQVDLGPVEPPARLHGDLWSGNVLWGADGRAWLIDPAAHGGHRESDLAMLALFGAPYRDRIVAGYEEVAPLAHGWRRRVGLHQAWPLLVHAALFPGDYAARAVSALRSVLP